MELNLEAQSFEALCHERHGGRPANQLGNRLFRRGGGDPRELHHRRFLLHQPHDAAMLFDDVDINVVPPGTGDELLPGTVDFEAPIYVAGESVIGVDGWKHFLGATAVVTTDALNGEKSVQLSGTRSIALRHFGPGTTYDDGTVLSAKVMIDGGSPADSSAEFHFSDAPEQAKSPAGIIATIGGNFFIFGLKDGAIVSDKGIDTGVPVLTDVKYLLEVELDLTSQTFDAYATNLTAGDPRVSLGTAEFWVAAGTDVLPGDDTTGGFGLCTRTGAVATYDDISVGLAPPDLLGDANDDGVVNDLDASILGAHWQMQSGATWADGDFNGDQKVDDRDAAILAAHWGGTGAEGSVPEPSTLVLLVGLVVGAGIVRRRGTRQR